ncbi:MAG: phosphopantetheine-binding protein [Streptosporangiaceae bacterium]
MDDLRSRSEGPLASDVRQALMSHPQVSSAEVVWMPDLEARPVAVVVTDGFASGPELRQHMKTALGVAGVPDLIAILPEIPRTAGADVDLVGLRDQLAVLPTVYRFVPPRSEVERWLAERWTALLDSHDLGIRDDFLELGGDSVSAISTLAEIHGSYGVEIAVADFFESATIERLAALIEAAR